MQADTLLVLQAAKRAYLLSLNEMFSGTEESDLLCGQLADFSLEMLGQVQDSQERELAIDKYWDYVDELNNQYEAALGCETE